MPSPAAPAAPSSTTSPPRNWLLRLAYDGTAYAGWQIQPAVPTIQGELQRALGHLFGLQQPRTWGCSRTDAGVHALAQMVTFLAPAQPPIPPAGARQALNHRLPPDIRVVAITEAAPEFHARHAATGKAYTYLIHRGGLTSPFLHRYCWPLGYELDLARMRTAADQLVGTHDFAAFTVKGNDPPAAAADTVRTVHTWHLREVGNFLAVTVVGASFLHKMVRRLTGFLVEVGRGRLTPAPPAALLRPRGPAAVAFATAPPQGLFLEAVFFDEATRAAFAPGLLPFGQLVGLDETAAAAAGGAPA